MRKLKGIISLALITAVSLLQAEKGVDFYPTNKPGKVEIIQTKDQIKLKNKAFKSFGERRPVYC